MSPPTNERRPGRETEATSRNVSGDSSIGMVVEPSDSPPFQVMPPLTAEEYAALSVDITARGEGPGALEVAEQFHDALTSSIGEDAAPPISGARVDAVRQAIGGGRR